MLVWEAFYRYQLQEFMNSLKYPSETVSNIEVDTMFTFVTDHVNASQITPPCDIRSLRNNLLKEINKCGLLKSFHIFNDIMCQLDDKYKFWHNFVHRDCLANVDLYLAIQSDNWTLRVASIKMLAPLFHAYDRTTYLRLVAAHLSDILIMSTSILNHLSNDGFAATLTGKSYKQLALDEMHESGINLDLKIFVHRPDAKCMNKSAPFLPYQASCQQNLFSLSCPVSLDDKKSQTFAVSKCKIDEQIFRKYIHKITNSQCFNHKLTLNKGLIKLFTIEVADFIMISYISMKLV